MTEREILIMNNQLTYQQEFNPFYLPEILKSLWNDDADTFLKLSKEFSTQFISEIIRAGALKCFKALIEQERLIDNAEQYLFRNWLPGSHSQEKRSERKQNYLDIAKIIIEHYEIDMNNLGPGVAGQPLIIFDSIVNPEFFKLYLSYLDKDKLYSQIDVFEEWSKNKKNFRMSLEECFKAIGEQGVEMLTFLYDYRNKSNEKMNFKENIMFYDI